jgi:uncharacterized protein YbjT (DUF2867 family)
MPNGRRIFVVGSTGGVGGRLTGLLTKQGHDVSGLHRSPDSADAVRAAGATPVQGDIAADSVDDFTARLAGHDAVVFCAGAGGGDQVGNIDGEGPGKIATAAAAAGIQRFVLVSVFMDAWRGDESPGVGFEQYMQAKRVADVSIAATDLDWLIVRPGTLSDDDGTGKINAGTAIRYGEISRDDVAAFLAATLLTPSLNRVAVEVTAGDLSVHDAVARLKPRQASL